MGAYTTCIAQVRKNETATMFCLKSFSSDENYRV